MLPGKAIVLMQERRLMRVSLKFGHIPYRWRVGSKEIFSPYLTHKLTKNLHNERNDALRNIKYQRHTHLVYHHHDRFLYFRKITSSNQLFYDSPSVILYQFPKKEV